MRLLQLGPNDELTLTKDLKDEPPPYAILSHTWGQDEEEVTFRDIMENTGKNKLGYEKIVFCGKQAHADNLNYFWVDTCCIDKTSSAELSESIISMFKWYQNAEKCYVYLADVTSNERELSRTASTWQPEFLGSRWFVRGWTLQELLAPASVMFFDRQGLPLGSKMSLKPELCAVTGIAETALLGAPLHDFKISERYEWARSRQTTREEDWAYSLQGIFQVHFSPQYGEGRKNAVRRLVNEIKNTLLSVETESFTLDTIGRTKIVNPLLLDIALLETLVRFDEAKAQVERSRSNIHGNARVLHANELMVSDMVSTFFKFLRGLLRYVLIPFRILSQLEMRLAAESITLRRVITSDKQIISDLKHDEECGEENLRELKRVEEFIHHQIGFALEDEMEILKQYARHKELEIPGEDTELARLKGPFSRLDAECQQIKQDLQLIIEQIKAQQTEIGDQVNKLESKQEEMERIRRERENQTAWQKIRAWIAWLLNW